MAAGGELIIDDKLVRAIHDMEKALQGVTKEADATQRKTMAWLSSLSSGNIDAFTNKIKQLESNYMNLANALSNSKGFENLSEKALNTAGAITQLITVMGQNTPKKTDGFDSIRQTLDSLLAQLAKARQDIDLYYQAIGTGKKEYIEFGQTGLKEAEARAESLMRKIEALNTTYQQLKQSSFNITDLTKGTMDDERSRIELSDIKMRLQEEERVHRAVMEHNLEELKAINDKIEAGIQGEKALAKAEEERHRKRQEYYNNVGKQWDIDDKAIRDANMTELKAISDKVENAKRAEKEAVESAKREHDAKQKYYEDFGKIIEEEEKRKKQANTDYYNWEMEQLAKEVKAAQDAANKKLQAEQEYAAKRKELQAMYTSLWDRNEADMMSARVAQRTNGQTWNVDANEVIRRTQEELAQRRQYIAERTAMYERMFEEIERKEKKVQDDIRNYEQQKQNESLAKYKQQKEEQARVDKHYHDKRQREYDEMFKAIERNEKRQRAINAKYGDSSKGAFNYSNRLYSAQGVRSIQNMETALNKLRDAQRRLNVGTEEGRKRFAELGAQIKKIEGDLNRVTDAGERMKKSHSGLINTGQQLARQLALVFSVSQIQGYMGKIVQVRKEFERQQRSLQILVQNQNEANKLWNQTVQLAVKSPFRVKELVTYTKQLAAYRIETEKLHDTTKMLADVSAGLGVDMNRLILAYGQVRAAEFLRGTELRQFTEAGIPMLEELSKHFSELEGRAVSTADVFERISKRMVVFEDVDAVFKKITSEGGTFYKMQEKQSETLYGMIANLHDSIDLMLNDIGKSNEGVLKAGLSQVKWLVEHWELLAEAIKGVAAALVIYKVRALAAKASVIDFAITQGIASGTQALKFTELLSVGWRKVAMAISAAKTALLSNPLAAIILAAAYAVSKLYSAWDDHNEQLADINKEYDELIRKVSNIRINFIFSDDLSKKKKELQSLIDTAEQLNISPNIKMDDVTNDNIDEIFNNLRQLVVERQGLITALSTDFEKATHWTFTDDLNEDLKEVGGNITKLTPIIDKYKSSVVDYIDKLGRLTDERKKMFEPIRKDENDLQYYDRLVRAFGEVRKAQKEASTSTEHWVQIMNEAPSVIKYTFDEITKWRANTNHYFDKEEAKKEFDAFIEEVLPMLKNIPEKDRSIAIKTWIDKEATKREWNTFTTQYLYKWFEEIPDLNIKFKAELPSEKSIPDWKMRVTDAVKKLNEKIKASLPEGSKIRLFTLPSDTDTKESWLNKFKGDIEEAKRVYQDNQAIFDEQEVARTNALSPYSREAEEIANIADKTTKEERDALKLMKERIALIKEMHSEYNKLRKHYSDEEAQLKVINAYSKSFKDAFGEWNIDMFRDVIDAQTLDQFHQLGTISDEVVGKIKQLADSGTYIRSFSDDFVDSIKKAEGFHDKAYKGDDNVWTIGYGETKGVKQGQTITQEAADLQLRTRLANDFKVQLNEILDKNKDLILTQEQYNALLDLSYQGGAGMVRRLIYLARNMDKSIEHVSNIQQKIGGVFGEEAAARFGDSFVQQLKDSENIYQRIALLLQTMNLTVRQGQISEKYYKGMQARSDKRSEWFATGKDISSVIASVTKQFKNVDISTKKGIVTFLESLAPIAAKEGEKVTEELNKAIDGFKAEIGIEVKIPKEKELIRRVENMFGTYELSLELKDMNIPSDLAEKLFGFETLDLKGLKEKLKELEPQFIGTDQEKKYRDYLQKVEEMEAKALKDRIKKFYKFLQDTTDAIQVAQQEGALDIQFATELFNSGKLTVEQYNQAVRKIIADTNKEISKLNLDKFKDSPEYIAAMGDMAGYTAMELTKLQNAIKNLIAKSSSTMQPEEIKAYNDALDKINDQLDRLKSPFSKTAISEIKEINRLNKELDAEKAKQLELEKRRRELETQESDLTTQLSQQKYHGAPQEEIDETISKIQETQEGIAKINGDLNTTAGNIANIGNKLQKLYGGSSKGWAKANKALTETFMAIDGAVQIFNEVKDLAASFGADVDTGAWSDLSIIFSSIGEMSQKFQDSWQSFVSGDIAGGIAGLVGGIFSVIKLFNQLFDNQLEKQIKQQEHQVKLMGKAYEKLEKQMEGAYSTDSIKQNTDEMLKNLEEQAAANEKMAELEQAKKDTDKEKVEQYLEERDKALEEREKLLIEREKAFGGFGGQEDYKSASEEFVDAWLSAFKETGSGLKGLQEKFDEFFIDMIKKQLLNNVMEKSMTAFYDDWDTALADGRMDAQDAESLKQAWKTLQGELDSKLQAMTEVMGVADDIRGTAELGTLQKGIQGVTEDTAEIIASYLNAMRFMLGEQSSNIKSITDNYGNIEAPNTMLGQLKMIADNTRAINDLLGSVTKAGHREGGYGIKVFTD